MKTLFLIKISILLHCINCYSMFIGLKFNTIRSSRNISACANPIINRINTSKPNDAFNQVLKHMQNDTLLLSTKKEIVSSQEFRLYYTPEQRACFQLMKEMFTLFTENNTINPLFDGTETIVHKILKSTDKKNLLSLIIPHATSENIRKKDKDLNSPLHITAKNYDIRNLSTLLIPKYHIYPDINSRNATNKTPLLLVLSQCYYKNNWHDLILKIVDLLTLAGASPYCQDNDKHDSFYYVKKIKEQQERNPRFNEDFQKLDDLKDIENLLLKDIPKLVTYYRKKDDNAHFW